MKHTAPEVVTRKLLDELHRLSPYDPDHLPGEIELIEEFRRRHPRLPRLPVADSPAHLPPRQPRQHTRPRLQGRRHHHHAV
jgi:acetate kinase